MRQSVVYLSISSHISYCCSHPLSFYSKISPVLWQQKSNQTNLHQLQAVQNAQSPVQGSWVLCYKLLTKFHLTQMSSFTFRKR